MLVDILVTYSRWKRVKVGAYITAIVFVNVPSYAIFCSTVVGARPNVSHPQPGPALLRAQGFHQRIEEILFHT